MRFRTMKIRYLKLWTTEYDMEKIRGLYAGVIEVESIGMKKERII
jgi:hypothetical protein